MPLVLVLLASGASAAPTDAELTARLAELERDTAHKSALAGPLGSAKKALDRARRTAKHGGWAPESPATDGQSALLRAVAMEWLDVARDLVRAVDAEQRANAALKALDETETKVVRGKALLEETVARRGRTQAALDALDRRKTESPPALPPLAKEAPKAPEKAKTPGKAPAKPPAPPTPEPRQ